MGLLDLLLPERCVGCGVDGSALCRGCCAGLIRLRAPLCARCGAPTAWPVERCRECASRQISFACARSAVAYEGAARALVGAWKEGGRRRLAEVASAIVVDCVPAPAADCVTCVPAVGDRALWRGHNPAHDLARLLACAWSLPVRPLLGRAGSPRPQRGLRADARRSNVRGAFWAAAPVPKRVALVDDVYTSGSTVGAAARALRAGGASRVEIVTFARALRGGCRR